MFAICDATAADYPHIDRLAELLHDERPIRITPVRQAARTFVAKAGDEVAAFAICTLTDYGISSSGYLEEVAVDAGARGAGLGRTLIEACEAWLRSEGIELVFVSALVGAEGFYEALGYRRCVGPWLARVLQPAAAD
jgi:GNAT superfamily N-acetyltransferase